MPSSTRPASPWHNTDWAKSHRKERATYMRAYRAKQRGDVTPERIGVKEIIRRAAQRVQI